MTWFLTCGFSTSMPRVHENPENERAGLLAGGVVVNAIDFMIATVARTHDLVLVPHNTKHFEVIPDLPIEDWLIS